MRIRHSNFIERTFGETRRRVKVIGRLPGEHSGTSLIWAVLDRASADWRGIAIAPADCDYWPTCATPCTNHQPNSANRTHHRTPKPSSHQPNQSPSHSRLVSVASQLCCLGQSVSHCGVGAANRNRVGQGIGKVLLAASPRRASRLAGQGRPSRPRFCGVCRGGR